LDPFVSDRLKQGIDKWCSPGRREGDQDPNQSKDQQDWNHPPSFVLSDEQDELADQGQWFLLAQSFKFIPVFR
jgi:hypothetical protein